MPRIRTPDSARFTPSTSRIAGIDIIRGAAILWVVLYHLWTDLRYPNVYPQQGDAFRAIPHRFEEANIVGGLTAIVDAILRVGYLGVPLFMMLSGLSLTVVALRGSHNTESTPRFLYRRLRRVMLPYWAGFAITLAFAAALAFVQWQRHGGAGYAQYLQNGDINVDGGQLFAGAFLVPRILRDGWQFAPEGSLWFVLVIAQYYLLFPMLLRLLKRVGPWMFLAGTLAVTIVALSVLLVNEGDLAEHRRWVEMAAPFRLFEFGLGMTLGYLLARRPQLLIGAARPAIAALLAAAGGALFVACCLIASDDDAFAVAQGPLIVLALTMMVVPLIVKAPGAVEATGQARALASVGVISYTVLIVSEPLRSVTHTMSAEHASDAWITIWGAVVYLPLTLVLARPLAAALGLMPRSAGGGPVESAFAGHSRGEASSPLRKS